MPRHVLAHPAQVENRVDPAQQVIARNPILEAEPVEQRRLLDLPSHHRATSLPGPATSSESRAEPPTQRLLQQPRSPCGQDAVHCRGCE
jgi:hypothetical protein